MGKKLVIFTIYSVQLGNHVNTWVTNMQLNKLAVVTHMQQQMGNTTERSGAHQKDY